ncbi:MAG: aminoacyl-tRNA hydrolase [Oscillospiraceae bacterium]|nr:aminoacyl-tRNA hydrolase [Oscillospiraceae bacterium]MDD4412990.1 aminoacyl-tRNA hydrolase [Oscillospiraceae bacterium]
MFFRNPKYSPVDFLVVGLGNPGKKYEGTRHNSGFVVLETLAQNLGVKVNRVKFKSLCGDGKIGDSRVLLMQPQTFMNASGEAVCEAMRFYKLKPEQVLVIFDDISLPVGAVRIRRKGSDGGQKGMQSIITLSGSDEFPRVKIGIGEKPHPDYELSAWVLSRFTKQEAALLLEAAETAAAAVCMIVQGNIDEAMNRYSK